jgi:hypothetical protein
MTDKSTRKIIISSIFLLCITYMNLFRGQITFSKPTELSLMKSTSSISILDFNNNLVLSRKDEENSLTTFTLQDLSVQEYGRAKTVGTIKLVTNHIRGYDGYQNYETFNLVVDFPEENIRLFSLQYLDEGGGIIIVDYKEKTIAFHEFNRKTIFNSFKGKTTYYEPLAIGTQYSSYFSAQPETYIDSISNDIVHQFRMSNNRTLLIPYLTRYPNGAGKVQPNKIEMIDKYFVYDEVSLKGQLLQEGLTKLKQYSSAGCAVYYSVFKQLKQTRDLSHPSDLNYLQGLNKINNCLNKLPILPIVVVNGRSKEDKKSLNIYKDNNLLQTLEIKQPDARFAYFLELSDDLKYALYFINNENYEPKLVAYKLPEFKFD